MRRRKKIIDIGTVGTAVIIPMEEKLYKFIIL